MAIDKRGLMFRLINYWPPFLGMGIRVRKWAKDFTWIDVEMKLRFWNRNIVGVHFGGSLYAMADPFFMAILMQNLGRDYIVWDKGANIRFKKPGATTVRAHFEISRDKIDEIRATADANYKVEPSFTVEITDTNGIVIAEIDKLLYVRRKDRLREA